MKKSIKIFLLLLLILPLFAFAEEKCEENGIIIDDVELMSEESNFKEKRKPDYYQNMLDTNLVFTDGTSMVKYKIIIKNNTNKEYSLDSSNIKSDSKYINYKLDYDEEILNPNEEKIVYLTIDYYNEVEDTILANGSYKETSKLSIDFLENEKSSNIFLIIIIVFFILLIIGIILFFIIRKQKKKNDNIIVEKVEVSPIASAEEVTTEPQKVEIDTSNLGKTLLLLIGLLLLVPTIVYANCKYTIDINSKIVVEGKDAIFDKGQKVNHKIRILANDTNIISIVKSEEEPNEDNKQERNTLSSNESIYPIYAWYEDGTIYWWSYDNTPVLDEDASYMFADLPQLTDISGLETLDTSNVKSMDYMFRNAKVITDYSAISSWDVSNVESMVATFANNYALLNLNAFEKWDVSKVTTMEMLFYFDKSMKDMSGIKNWNVSNVTNMQLLFSSCTDLEVIDLSKWETKSLTNLNSTFGMWGEDKHPIYTAKLKKIIISEKFDTSNVTEMIETFANLTILEDYTFLKYFDTSKVTTMKQLFQCNYNLKDLSVIKDWDVSNVTSLLDTFSFCKSLESLKGLEKWDVSNVTNMSRTFLSDSKLTDISSISKWNVSKVTEVDYMFGECYALKDATPISTWSLPKVNNFDLMFYGLTNIKFPSFVKYI